MTQLSLSWLGLGSVAASPWLLLMLFGVFWLLTRILAWIYAFYENLQHLQCFPQPPKRNWFLGQLGQVPSTEEGLQFLTRAVHTYPQGFVLWFGPILPMVTLCHPDTLRFVLSASGTHVKTVLTVVGSQPSSAGRCAAPCGTLAPPPLPLSVFLPDTLTGPSSTLPSLH